MKIWKDILVGIVGVVILALGVCGLFVFGGGGMNGGETGSCRMPSEISSFSLSSGFLP